MNVLITGASSGIGRALSLKGCGKDGWKILGVGRNREALEEIKRTCDSTFEYAVYDLSDLSSIRGLVQVVEESFAPLDLLINNAGFGAYRSILEMTDSEVISMTSVNFIAPLLLTKNLVEKMKEGSAVVNVISGGAFVLMRKLPLYGATKLALHYASEALRRELEERGIHLMNVYPGVVLTNFHSRAGSRASMNGLNPEEVAEAIYDGIAKRKKNVYIPKYLKLAKLLFGPVLPPLF